jgi:ketosteroid isomerase-like protein
MGNIMFRGMLPCIAYCAALSCAAMMTVSCTPGSPTVDLAAEKAALLKRDNEWQAAVDKKTDVDKIMSFIAADGVIFGTNEPTIDTREELMKAVSGLTNDPGFKEHWGWSRVEISSDGKLAYLLGTTERTTTDAGGHVVTTHARVVNVWRKEPDGVWRCILDVFVDEPTAPT